MLGSAPDDGAGAIFQEVTYEGPSSPYSGTQRRAVVTRDWHFIRNLVPDDTRELYHRSVDPEEEHDLSGIGEPAEAQLAAELATWMDEIALPADFRQEAAGNLQPTPYAPSRALGDSLGDLARPRRQRRARSRRSSAATTSTSRSICTLARPIPPGWRLFTHVVGPGRMINADHEPVEGTMPLVAPAPRQLRARPHPA